MSNSKPAKPEPTDDDREGPKRILKHREPKSPTRPFVDSFADAMEAKLEKNRHKGDREGWLKDTPMDLFKRLQQEMFELLRELSNEANPDAVLSEAADVANFAMMIADSYQNRSSLRAAGGGGEGQ